MLRFYQLNAITLRNIPPELETLIERRARETGASLNRTVINLLRESLQPKPSGPPYTDLDDLAGTWSKEEAREFDQFISDAFERVDSDDWK